jgi:hypothetical protein
MALNEMESDDSGKTSGKRRCRSRMRRNFVATSFERSAGICRRVTQFSSSRRPRTCCANGVHFTKCFFFRSVFVVFKNLLRQWSHIYEVNWREIHPLGGGMFAKYVPTTCESTNWLSDTSQAPKLVTTSRNMLQSSCRFDHVGSCLQTHRLLSSPGTNKILCTCLLLHSFIFF